MHKCFIIMPITTPASCISEYAGDADHFRHVLEHLFIPTLEILDIDPIPPSTRGSEIIHGEIIRNLETADLVLCDMSILNPNVFFELGIRTALNKPVCMVRDNLTEVPFDTTIINHHVYRSTLASWEIEKQKELLAEHIKASIDNLDNNNALWSIFSMTLQAKPNNEPKGIDEKLDYLNLQFDGLRRQLNPLRDKTSHSREYVTKHGEFELLKSDLLLISGLPDEYVQFYDYGDGSIEMSFDACLDDNISDLLIRHAKSQGYRLNLLSDLEHGT